MRLVSEFFQQPFALQRRAAEVEIEAAALVAAVDELVRADVFDGDALAPLLRHFAAKLRGIDREFARRHRDELPSAFAIGSQDPAFELAAHVQPQLVARFGFRQDEEAAAGLGAGLGEFAVRSSRL